MTDDLDMLDLEVLARAFSVMDRWREASGEPLRSDDILASVQRQFDLGCDHAAGLIWLWGITWNDETTAHDRAAVAINVAVNSTR